MERASFDDIRELFRRYPVIGAAAGSVFVLKGKYRAVLINNPSIDKCGALACAANTG